MTIYVELPTKSGIIEVQQRGKFADSDPRLQFQSQHGKIAHKIFGGQSEKAFEKHILHFSTKGEADSHRP